MNVETVPDAGGGGGGDTPGGGAPDGLNHPTVTIGNGRNDVVDPNAVIKGEGGASGVGAGRSATRYTPLRIPMLRIRMWVQLGDVLRTLSQPTPPPPSPSPAFRTQDEAPVIDATPVGGGGDGGSERIAATADGPKVFEVPLVAAPRMPVGGTPRLTRAGSPAASPAAGQPAVVGANTPLIRGCYPRRGHP